MDKVIYLLGLIRSYRLSEMGKGNNDSYAYYKYIIMRSLFKLKYNNRSLMIKTKFIENDVLILKLFNIMKDSGLSQLTFNVSKINIVDTSKANIINVSYHSSDGISTIVIFNNAYDCKLRLTVDRKRNDLLKCEKYSVSKLPEVISLDESLSNIDRLLNLQTINKNSMISTNIHDIFTSMLKFDMNIS